MKKITKLLFSVACFSMLSLSACGAPKHTHKYSEDWESDETYHWHVCESCGEKINKEEHVYDNAHDTVCNICGRSGRTPIHTWSTEWSKDAETHWHACTGCEEKQDEAAHVYDNDHDDKCNECGYDRSLGDHAASSSWAHNETHHWHPCEHDGCELKYDEAEHSFDDDHDSTCECGYVRDLGDHTPKSALQYDDSHHWHACNHSGCDYKFDYEEHHLNATGGCIDCNASFETIYDIDYSTQSCNIAFNNLEAKTYYFWVSELSVDLTYQIRFPYDQVVNCYYYESASATELSLRVYNFKYIDGSYFLLPSVYGFHTTLFFNFTVGQDKVGANYTSISVRSFDI